MLPDGQTVAFAFDANGNLAGLTPPGRPPHAFAHDALDQLADYSPPTLGTEPAATRYEYNLDRQPTKKLRPDGQTIYTYYDPAGRLDTLATPAGTTRHGYDAAGRLASLTTAAGIGLATRYDGGLATGTTASGPVPGTLATTYDAFFRPSQIAVNGSAIGLAYDADGLLTAAGSLSLSRDPGHGLVTATTLGGTATATGYDGYGEINRLMARQGTSILYDERIVRDPLGRPVEKTQTVAGETHTWRYAYDAAGRLIDVTMDGAPAGHYGYDANGNRILADGVPASYDAQDRLTRFGDAQYRYTANGELMEMAVGASTTTYAYDALGDLAHAELADGTVLDYLADGRNRRVGKKLNGTLIQGFLWQDQLKPAAELDGQGKVVARFVYAGRANVPEYLIKGGVSYRLVTDALGSVRLVVDSGSGEIVQRLDYDAWGRVLLDSQPGFQPFGFAGGLYDRHTGLVRFGARDYDPRSGRWTAKDPIGFAGGDTGLYSYVGGNPLRYIDPLGEAWTAPIPGVPQGWTPNHIPWPPQMVPSPPPLLSGDELLSCMGGGGLADCGQCLSAGGKSKTCIPCAAEFGICLLEQCVNR